MIIKIRKNNIPNILTILRILFIPFILIFMTVPFGNQELYTFTIFKGNQNFELTTTISLNYLLAGILFVVACITDWLDGYLSRKFNWVSDFGKIWDPIADKALNNSIMVVLAYLKIIPWYFLITMVIRDLAVDGYRTYLASKKIIIPANIFGKLKTVLQMLAIIVVFFVFNQNNEKEVWKWNSSFFLIQNILFIFATVASLISGVIYIIKSIKFIRNDNYKNEIENSKNID